jgi:hypothetical protein
MLVPVAERPGFCSECYCEVCGTGFYEKAREGIRYVTGKQTWIVCNKTPGCTGHVRPTPLMSWARLRACRTCEKQQNRAAA